MPVISFIIDFIVETNENPAYHSFSVFTDFITGTISETQTNQLIPDLTHYTTGSVGSGTNATVTGQEGFCCGNPWS